MARENVVQAMSDERLAEIKQSAADAGYAAAEFDDPYAYEYAAHVPQLLAEVERLRTREAALAAQHEQAMEVMRAVSDTAWSNALGTRIGGTPEGGKALVRQARAWLASVDEPGEA